jgi:hypothetical protein
MRRATHRAEQRFRESRSEAAMDEALQKYFNTMRRGAGGEAVLVGRVGRARTSEPIDRGPTAIERRLQLAAKAA